MAIFKQHETWSSSLTFLLAAVGAAIGLGNIWKFPWFYHSWYWLLRWVVPISIGIIFIANL